MCITEQSKFIYILNDRLFRLIRPLFIVWSRLIACSLHWNCLLDLEQFGAHAVKCIIWRKILECFHQKP